MILLATGNKHKIHEIQAIIGPSAGSTSLTTGRRTVDKSWHYEEGLESLMENAIGKAVSAVPFAQPGEIVLAEDTGLFVDALNGAPGVASARYAGENVTFDQNVKKLLENMKGIYKRKAAFMTVAAACLPDGRLAVSCGRLDGEITEEPIGNEGFGYDPIFLVSSLGKTLAQMNTDCKNQISHRANALRALVPYLNT